MPRGDLSKSRAEWCGDLSVKPGMAGLLTNQRLHLIPRVPLCWYKWDAGLAVQHQVCLGTKSRETWAAGELWVCGRRESTPETSIGDPSLLLPFCLWEEAGLSPRAHPLCPGRHDDYSLGDFCRFLLLPPERTQGFLPPINWIHSSREHAKC